MRPFSVQDSNVAVHDVHGLRGRLCEAMVGVCERDELVVAYAQIEGQWLRFYLDEGVLFLDPSDGPDPEEDLESEVGGQLSYVDILSRAGGASEVENFAMADGTLRIELKSGGRIRASDDGEGVRWSVVE